MSLASFDDEVWAGGYVQPGLGIRKPLVLRGADSGEHWDDRSPAALPLSDECRALALDPADTSIVYAGNCFALFESKDGGEHWQAAFVSRALQGVSSLVFDPSDSQTVYIATRGNGIYRYAGLVV